MNDAPRKIISPSRGHQRRPTRFQPHRQSRPCRCHRVQGNLIGRAVAPLLRLATSIGTSKSSSTDRQSGHRSRPVRLCAALQHLWARVRHKRRGHMVATVPGARPGSALPCILRSGDDSRDRYIPAAHSTPTYRTRATPMVTDVTIAATRHQSFISCPGSISMARRRANSVISPISRQKITWFHTSEWSKLLRTVAALCP